MNETDLSVGSMFVRLLLSDPSDAGIQYELCDWLEANPTEAAHVLIAGLAGWITGTAGTFGDREEYAVTVFDAAQALIQDPDDEI